MVKLMCGCGVVGASFGSEFGDFERLDLMGFRVSVGGRTRVL